MYESKWFIANNKFVKVVLKSVKGMHNVYVSDRVYDEGVLYYSSPNLTFATQVFNSI